MPESANRCTAAPEKAPTALPSFTTGIEREYPIVNGKTRELTSYIREARGEIVHP